MFSAALFSLALVCHAAVGADSDDDRTATNAVTVGANGDDTASIPDFDGDGTIGFSDFLIFAGAFGSSEGDEKYDARYDLNGDGEIGFSDFVIFARNFGRVADTAPGGSSRGGTATTDGFVVSFSVSDTALTAVQSFTLEATVHNKQIEDIIPSIAVGLDFYRSTDGRLTKPTRSSN